MSAPTYQELEGRFEQAYRQISGSQESQDREMLAAGIELMKATAAACRQMADSSALGPALERIQNSIDVSGNIFAYEQNDANSPYFDLMLDNFSPPLSAITGNPHRPETTSRLVKSLLSHESERGPDNYALKTFDFNGLLSHLGGIGSKEAFALVLEECLKRLDAQDIKPLGEQGFGVRVLPLINDFAQSKGNPKALPTEILDVLARHPFQILAEHNKYLKENKGCYLRMGVLQAMLNHSPYNERLTDVVIEIASNSLYEMMDSRQLLWAECLGVRIDRALAERKLIGHGPVDDRKTALYYLMSSPKVSSLQFAQILGKIANGIEPVVPMIVLSLAIKTFREGGEQDELIIDKTISLIKHLLVKDQNTANTLIAAKWLPIKRILKDHTLREQIFSSDLGM